ncbi:MAG: helical backbone metal receptor [Bacteroidota bacterium]
MKDQMGREVRLPRRPQRIVSLVPSITEYLLDLGLGEKVVGRTKFCVHPRKRVAQIPGVGGTKDFKIDRIHNLQPDLIIGNREENVESGIKELARSYPVWMSDIESIDQNFEMMQALGDITGKSDEAQSWIERVRLNFSKHHCQYSGKVLYLIWRRPYMVAGKGTFINAVLEYLGFENIVLQKRYPQIDDYILETLAADKVFLSSEPFPFKETHVQEFKKLFPNALTKLVDGEAFSWYGSRLAKVNFDL